MSDLPLDKKSRKATEVSNPDKEAPTTKVEITPENTDKLIIHFLAQIYARLGYMIKLMEEKK